MLCILLKDDSLLRILRFSGYFETPLFRTFFRFPLGRRNSGVPLYTKYSMTAPLGNQLVLAPENVGKIQRTGYNVILQIEHIPNIKISMIKNLFGSRDSFIPHSRVQSNIVWSRPPIWKSLVY